MTKPPAEPGPDGAESDAAAAASAPAAAPPKKKKRKSADPEPKSLFRRIFSVPGLVVTLAAGGATIYGFWDKIRPIFVGPRLELSLTECRPDKISLNVQNSGGRAAIVSPPVISVYRDGGEHELPVSEFVGREVFQANHARIEPKAGYVLPYPSTDGVPFFRPEWSRGRPCPIRARMTLTEGEGPGELVEATCPCAQSR
jgi:hypothetical protein